MSEFYDQDLEPEQGSSLKSLAIWIGVGALLGFLLSTAYSYYEDWNAERATKPNRDVSSFRSQTIDWTSCDESMFVPVDWRDSEFDASAAQCGEFAVPATYSEIIGKDLPDLTIKMLRTPALDQENKLGTLFFNPGGPGESGINVVQTIAVPDEIRARYDLVGFDPRGVGKSSPIKCSDTDSIDYYFETVSSPEDKAEGDANLAWDKEAVENCAKLNPDWWVMTTLNTVQDMDVMREVVTGNAPFNFVGFSYGTTLAVEYIRAFPEQAGRIVLDSVTSNDDTDYNQAELESTYKALVALFEMCAEDAKCPGESVAEVENLIFEAQDKANAGKLSGTAKYLSNLDEEGDFVESDDQLLYDGLMALSYGDTETYYPYFSDAMNDLVNGDAWLFEFEALSLYGWRSQSDAGDDWVRNNSSDILQIVNCLDVDSRDQRSLEKIKKDEERFAAADPFTTKFFEADSGYLHASDRGGCQWSWLAFDDPAIPDPPDVMKSPVNESGKTFLVIGSALDTVTPIENAKDTAEKLSSRMLVYEGSGHAPSFGGIACIDDAVTKYLVEGYLPAETIVCAAK
jgi:pimeloyl-ACP methyl ester carboxylesterase